MKGIFPWVLLPVMFFSAAVSGEQPVKARMIMGWIEPVVLIPWGVRVKAKLDSGAKTSSIHAKRVERFEKDDQTWVRFVIPVKSGKKKLEIQVERPLVRNVRIKRHKIGAHQRPVVSLPFCLNRREYEAQFNLIDRSHFNYPVLLGRRFLKDVALIDPGAVFLSSGDGDDCGERNPDPLAERKGRSNDRHH